jgi:hypothetical protein
MSSVTTITSDNPTAPGDIVYLVQFNGTDYDVIGDSNTNDLGQVKV